MNTFTVLMCLIIIACGAIIIASTIYDMLKYYHDKYNNNEEET